MTEQPQVQILSRKVGPRVRVGVLRFAEGMQLFLANQQSICTRAESLNAYALHVVLALGHIARLVLSANCVAG